LKVFSLGLACRRGCTRWIQLCGVNPSMRPFGAESKVLRNHCLRHHWAGADVLRAVVHNDKLVRCDKIPSVLVSIRNQHGKGTTRYRHPQGYTAPAAAKFDRQRLTRRAEPAHRCGLAKLLGARQLLRRTDTDVTHSEWGPMGSHTMRSRR
jgi:hypothetical protein